VWPGSRTRRLRCRDDVVDYTAGGSHSRLPTLRVGQVTVRSRSLPQRGSQSWMRGPRAGGCLAVNQDKRSGPRSELTGSPPTASRADGGDVTRAGRDVHVPGAPRRRARALRDHLRRSSTGLMDGNEGVFLYITSRTSARPALARATAPRTLPCTADTVLSRRTAGSRDIEVLRVTTADRRLAAERTGDLIVVESAAIDVIRRRSSIFCMRG